MTLTTCIISRGRTEYVSKAIESVDKISDEIILCLIDTSDEDAHIIAEKYPEVKIARAKFCHDISRCWNRCVSMATSDFVFCMNDYECIGYDTSEYLMDFKEDGIERYDVIYMTVRENIYVNHFKSYNLSELQARIIRNSKLPGFKNCICETMYPIYDVESERYIAINGEDAVILKVGEVDSELIRDIYEHSLSISRPCEWTFIADYIIGCTTEEKADMYRKSIAICEEDAEKVEPCLKLAKLYLTSNEYRKGLKYALVCSAMADECTPEICLTIGALYMGVNELGLAKEWLMKGMNPCSVYYTEILIALSVYYEKMCKNSEAKELSDTVNKLIGDEKLTEETYKRYRFICS